MSKILTTTLLSAAGLLTALDGFGQNNDAYEMERAKILDKVAPEFAQEPNFFAYEENKDSTATIIMAGKKEKYNMPGDLRAQVAFTFYNSDNDPHIGSKGDRLRSVEILSLSKATAKEYCNKHSGFSANFSAIAFYEDPYDIPAFDPCKNNLQESPEFFENKFGSYDGFCHVVEHVTGICPKKYENN